MQKTGVKMAEESWDGGVGMLRAKIQGGNNNWDVVQVESEELLLGCEEGLYEKHGLGEARRQGQVHAGRSTIAASARSSTASCSRYDGDKIKGDAPKSLGRFLERAEVAGQARAAQGAEDDARDRADGRRRRAEGRLQDAATDAGVERAFRKLDQLKPNLVWWEKGSQPPQLLASGEVAMTDAYNGRIAAANEKDKKNFKIVWTNNLYTIDSWVIMKGTPNKADAEKYLVFVNHPDNQKNLPKNIPLRRDDEGATAIASLMGELPTNPGDPEPGVHGRSEVLAREPRQDRPALNAWVGTK